MVKIQLLLFCFYLFLLSLVFFQIFSLYFFNFSFFICCIFNTSFLTSKKFGTLQLFPYKYTTWIPRWSDVSAWNPRGVFVVIQQNWSPYGRAAHAAHAAWNPRGVFVGWLILLGAYSRGWDIWGWIRKSSKVGQV